MTEGNHNTNGTGAGTGLREIALIERDGEPRARDIEIAERLGFKQPRDIRKTLARHRGALEGFGPVLVAETTYRGQKSEEWHLNEEQALYAATVSDAPNAPAVRAMLIRTFVAWRRGHLQTIGVSLPETITALIERTDGIARQLSHRVKVLQDAVTDLQEKRATPALDFGGTVSAHQMIEMAGIDAKRRQRGTAQMVTNRMLAFCAQHRVACVRTPAVVNPSEPYRFPHAMACDWLLGESKGAEIIRCQIERARAKKARRGAGTGQAAFQLVPTSQPAR